MAPIYKIAVIQLYPKVSQFSCYFQVEETPSAILGDLVSPVITSLKCLETYPAAVLPLESRDITLPDIHIIMLIQIYLGIVNDHICICYLFSTLTKPHS
jgi:hypothetical protein